jgi:uncharacterized membrane protein YbaN (DUF454 family)
MGEKQPVTTNTYLRVFLTATGTVLLTVGIVGIFVPILPTTPFLLLAAICYARSSQRLYRWLLTNKWFGKYFSNYLQKKGVPLPIKAFTIGLLWLAIGVSVAFAVEVLAVRAVLVIIAIGVTLHLVYIQTLK